MTREDAHQRDEQRWRRAFVAALSIIASPIVHAQTENAGAALKLIERNQCEQAIDALNRGMQADEAASYSTTGQLFEDGVCLRKDATKAVAVYSQAARLGDTASATRLALMCASGTGVPQSYARAGYWLAVAHGQAQPDAATDLDRYATPDALARTYVEVVHGLAEHDLVYPDVAAQEGVHGWVVMRFDPRTGDTHVVESHDTRGSTASGFGPSYRTFERVLAASYRDALARLPKPLLPDAGDYATDHRVAFDRDRNNRRLIEESRH